MGEYTEIIKRLEIIMKNYPKILKEYVEAGRLYRGVYSKHAQEVFGQYSSQPGRDNALESIMQETETDILDRWQAAEYEYNLVTNEQRILNLIAKLLTSRDLMRGILPHKGGELWTIKTKITAFHAINGLNS